MMEITEWKMMLVGIAGIWILHAAIKNTIAEVRTIKRCSVQVTAEILSWTVEEDGDDPTRYIPTIRYSYDGQVYETFFQDGALTWYQKKHYDPGNTQTICLDPENPVTITPENKRQRICSSIGTGMAVSAIALFSFLIGIVYFLQSVI